ncbi:MAG: hypothetical protein IV090_27165 [Candidatus Sericytochromatia bacterium]|nr:hypothetical protein [Candidatus Sericytochromatia bacterium]
MERLYVAVICLLLAACQPLSANPGASPKPRATASPSPTVVITSPTTLPAPIPSLIPSLETTTNPDLLDESMFVTTLPSGARPTPIPQPPLLHSALILLAGSDTPGFQDGQGEQAKFNKPLGISLDGQGNIFVADSGNHAIRKVSSDGNVSTIAGTGQPGNKEGQAKQAQFIYPNRLIIDNADNVFVLEYLDSNSIDKTENRILRRIRKIDKKNNVSTINLNNKSILNKYISNIYFHKDSNQIYINSNNEIFSILEENQVTQIANQEKFSLKNSGLLDAAQKSSFLSGSSNFYGFREEPNIDGLVIGKKNHIFVLDVYRKLVWKIDSEGESSVFIGGGQFFQLSTWDACDYYSRFFNVSRLSLGFQENIYMIDKTFIRQISSDGCSTTLKIQEKTGGAASVLSLKVSDLVVDYKGILYILSENKVYKLDLNARAAS